MEEVRSRLREVKLALAEKFDVKDLGDLNYFLGVKIEQDHRAEQSGLVSQTIQKQS